ncbi:MULTISPECIES: serine/threonine-protein kinase [unclassified Streptomyces]|uniref:serine/threonine-protein kinase n=1 Tax=unclassified Streptomyces TaxID=2593676 RepID=UPI0033B3839C
MPDRPIAGRYELLEPLGHGGMGDVWRGYDAVLDRPVAVKRIRPQAVAATPQLTEELERRFRREARVTARVRHPGVPQVYDAVLDRGHEHLCLVMELVEGVPLTRYVSEERPLPVSWAVAVAAQVTTVLSYAHDVPVVHRDLKPSNVLVTRDGTVKVLDFGVAAILRTDVTRLTASGRPIGTHRYMAPEQVRGTRVSPRTDLYALGCVLHELLCGKPVFGAGSDFELMERHVRAAPTPLRRLRADVPEELEALVLHLLRKAPEARPVDVQEVYDRLVPFLPAPGESSALGEAGPPGAPDPTGLYRRPYAPRARSQSLPRPAADAAAAGQDAGQVMSPPDRELLRARLREVDGQYIALMAEERYTQAAEVAGEMVEPLARALGAENKAVLRLRRRRAISRQLAGDHRAALAEFETLAEAYGRINGPTGEEARDCRAQAARCRGELGQVTEALAELKAVLDVERAVESDVSDAAVELRRDIGMLLLGQGEPHEALACLEVLYEDVLLVHGPGHDVAEEVAEVLSMLRRELGAG